MRPQSEAWLDVLDTYASTVLARHDVGSRSISVSGIGGTAAAAFIPRSWQRITTFGLTMSTKAGINVLRHPGQKTMQHWICFPVGFDHTPGLLFMFIKEELTGTNPKVLVRFERSKLECEVIGYGAAPTYFVAAEDRGLGKLHRARFTWNALPRPAYLASGFPQNS